MEKDVTRNIEEQLSAFLDGELPEAELQLLVRRLERDQSYRATLGRYAAIGSVLRKDPVQVSGDELRQRLMIVMQDEIPAAQNSPVDISDASFYGKRVLLAAAVAVLAIVGVYNTGFIDPGWWSMDESQGGQLVGAPAGAGRLANDSKTVISITKDSSQSRSGSYAVRQAAINPQRMTSYLVSHGEFSRAFQGVIVDSRIFVQQASFED